MKVVSKLIIIPDLRQTFFRLLSICGSFLAACSHHKKVLEEGDFSLRSQVLLKFPEGGESVFKAVLGC